VTDTHPAPLVAPTARRRWFVPLAAAAVIFLVIAVTLHMQWEQRSQAELAAPPSSAQAGKLEQLETPERWLERIVRLRREGKHEEADRSYAEFRKRYPDYPIPESIRAQVLPR